MNTTRKLNNMNITNTQWEEWSQYNILWSTIKKWYISVTRIITYAYIIPLIKLEYIFIHFSFPSSSTSSLHVSHPTNIHQHYKISTKVHHITNEYFPIRKQLNFQKQNNNFKTMVQITQWNGYKTYITYENQHFSSKKW